MGAFVLTHFDHIIHRLNNICRWSGAVVVRDCDRIFSVLEHTTIGLYLMRQNDELIGDRIGFATHDLHEWKYGDLITPFKTLPTIKTQVAAIERIEHEKICVSLGIDRTLAARPKVKEYDLIMAAAENYEIHTGHADEYPYDHAIHGRAAELVATGVCSGKQAFLDEWKELGL